jgi:hypothetical protein
MPAYNLSRLTCTTNYELLFSEGKLKIMGHLEHPKIKMFLELNSEAHSNAVLNALTHTDTVRKWNQ